MLLLYLSFWLPPAIVFGRQIYSRRQLSQIYRIDASLITHHFDDLLKPLIKTYNSSRKANSLSSRETVPLVSSMMSFQEMYPLVPAIPRLDQEPVPWDGPKNPYKPHFVGSVLRDDWSPGMRYTFNRNQLIHGLASTLDDVFFLPAPWKLITAFSAGVAFIFIDVTVRFRGIHLYYVGRCVAFGLLIAVLFYILMSKDITDLMSYPVYFYGPDGSPQSITFWNLYMAFRREVLPSVKAAHKNLISPADLERVYTCFRACYPLVDPEFPGQE